jgi:glyoxylase-like metal-dependent hydrolase (beta-lactamase superfamily II)
MVGHVTVPAAAPLGALPDWVTLVRAPNPGPMTLDGTNTWVLRAPGEECAIVVDPGPADGGHLGAIVEHAPVGFILVTHGHPDHIDGLPHLVELLGGVNVIAADEALSSPADPLARDEAFGGFGIDIQTMTTPGHTGDSVCFVAGVGDELVVLTGDTILGRGTTVVAHPDGDLGDYLASLTRLAELDGVPVLPGHGPALSDCAVAATFYLEHRRARLEQVRSARAAGAGTPAEVVAAVYADVDRGLWPAAEWSVRAQLAYLDRERESEPGPQRLDPP